MVNITGYRTVEKVHESMRSVVFKGQRSADDLPVILKLLKGDYPAPEDLARYRREYEIAAGLEIEGAIKPLALEKFQNSLVLVLEDFNGQDLKTLLGDRPFTLVEILEIGAKLACILAEIHDAGLIHRDIKPSNIVYHRETGRLKIIDFGSAIQPMQTAGPAHVPGAMVGTLPYISPEQTGRMNRPVDLRSDLYSTGVTLYELLTGSLPFESTDPLELVHAHLARSPRDPSEINPEVPRGLSRIVLKLLAKNAEDRYQTAMGLNADLEESLNKLRATGTISAFSLGARDFSDRLRIPSKLYGREGEQEKLAATLERVCRGSKEMLLVTGPAGMGKSMLIMDLQRPVTGVSGHFISGRFDRFERNVPYSALAAAFADLVRQLLTRSETDMAHWKERLLGALGQNGAVIIDLIPELELIAGPQPAPPALEPAAAQNRLKVVFTSFIRVFCRPESPLVLFLDNLNWADAASLGIIESIMTDDRVRFLFVVGAYRDEKEEEVPDLARTIQVLKEQGIVLEKIRLTPLNFTDVALLCRETLHPVNEDDTAPLAGVIMDKTDGNPFFVHEFFRMTHEEAHLAFDLQTRSWRWNLEDISELGVMENVADLIAAKILKLEPRTREGLKLAAIIGHRFDLETLAAVCDRHMGETAAAIQPAATEGLLTPEGEAGYRFAHDRVRQTAYALIPEPDRPALHLKLGRRMLGKTPPDMRADSIFDLVGQLNPGSRLIEEDSERQELAELNLTAGRRARSTGAWEAALDYFKTGLALLGENCWENSYDLALALYGGAAEAAYLTGDFEEMDRMAAAVLRHARTFLDRVKIDEVKIDACKARNAYREAMNIGRAALKQLGVSLPEKPSKAHVMAGYLRTKIALTGKRIEDLVNLPEMTDPAKLAAVRIMDKTSSASYYIVPELFPVIVFKAIRLSLKHGHSSWSPPIYGGFGLLLCGVIGDVETGIRFTQLSVELAERFKAKDVKATALFLNGFVLHWQKHARESIPVFIECFQSGLETGNLEYAAYGAFFDAFFSFQVGRELPKVERKINSYLEAVRPLRQEISINWLRLYQQLVRNLMGRAEDPRRLTSETYNEEEMVSLFKGANDQTSLFNFYYNKAYLAYIFEDYHMAREYAALAREHMEAVPGAPIIPLVIVFDSLAGLAVFSEADRIQQKRILKKVAANQKKMKKWAGHAAMNQLHRYYLVEAERCRVLGQNARAGDFFDLSIAGSRESEYIQEEALAKELTARFYLARRKIAVARAYMQEARYGYLRWGAEAKVRQLDERYPELLGWTPSADLGAATTETTISVSSSSDAKDTLDLTAAMRAARAMSGEIVLKDFLGKLMTLVMESAGAQKGFLISKTDARLLIQAEASAEEGLISVKKALPLESHPGLSHGIVHYVERTQEAVVLDDAPHKGGFTNEPYVLNNAPKSILCAPLIHQDKLVAVLYLENNLTTAAFTPSRLEVLGLLCAQGAISLENAHLYEQLTDYSQHLEAIIQALDVAQEVQQNLLPHSAPRLGRIDLAGRSLYCDQTGGDYFDYIEISRKGSNLTAVVVGDVSGHGVSSALLMSSVRAYLRARLTMPGSAGEIITFVNRLVSTDCQETGHFMTLFYLEVEPHTGRLAWVRAGHDPALVYSPATDTFTEMGGRGLALGVDKDWQYQDYTAEIEPGQIAILATDGIWETQNQQGRMFGKEKFREIIRQNAHFESEAIRRAVFQAVTVFRGEVPQEDDITLVLMKYK